MESPDSRWGMASDSGANQNIHISVLALELSSCVILNELFYLLCFIFLICKKRLNNNYLLNNMTNYLTLLCHKFYYYYVIVIIIIIIIIS